MSDNIAHRIERTSPKGEPFIGVCMNCGATGLTPADIFKPCRNPEGVDRDESLLRAIDPSRENH